MAKVKQIIVFCGRNKSLIIEMDVLFHSKNMGQECDITTENKYEVGVFQ